MIIQLVAQNDNIEELMRFLILIPCILDFVLILKGEIGCPSFFLSKRFSTEKFWIDRKSLGTWDWNEDNINIGTVPKYHVNRRANEFRLWSIFARAFEGFPSSHRPIKYSASAHGSMTSCCQLHRRKPRSWSKFSKESSWIWTAQTFYCLLCVITCSRKRRGFWFVAVLCHQWF